LEKPLKGDEVEIFASGTLMLNGEEKPLFPANLEIITSTFVRIEIVEGKYQQVKRMFAAVFNKVIKLHRTKFADFEL
ncbi:16S rRNA pseudouridine(516) synthase, partial [Aliarcobacter butzleri]